MSRPLSKWADGSRRVMRAAHRQRVATLPRVSGLLEAGAREMWVGRDSFAESEQECMAFGIAWAP
jgi:hypothetical protein